MTLNPLLRRLLLASALALVCATGVIVGQQKYGMPKTVIHVVTLKWTDESTPAQRQKVFDGIRTWPRRSPA